MLAFEMLSEPFDRVEVVTQELHFDEVPAQALRLVPAHVVKNEDGALPPLLPESLPPSCRGTPGKAPYRCAAR